MSMFIYTYSESMNSEMI